MIFIVIPVFNRWHFTNSCLESLGKQTYQDFKIVVVDHGSNDGTSQYIIEKYPNVILLNGDERMWWAAATNMGVKYALDNKAKYILTLNNDTITESEYLEKLLEALGKTSPSSLIGSTAEDVKSGNIVYQGEKQIWFTETSHKLSDADLNSNNRILEVSHYPGRGLLIPIEVFMKIGFYDEKYFPHYMSDYDFTLRAKRAGYKIFCSLDALLKVYPEASGANQLKMKKSLKKYYQHLFGIKGGANLPLFYRYALRHCPLYALPSYLFFGTIRRLLGYWL